jgi:hypothetical protein
MAQAVICRPLTVDTWVRYQASPCRFCDGQNSTRTSFYPRTSVSSHQYHYTNALYSVIYHRLHMGLQQQLRVSLLTQILHCHPKRPERLWDPPSLLFSGYRGPFSGVKRPKHEANHFHLVPRLSMSGCIPLLPLQYFMAWTGKILPFFQRYNLCS